MRIKMRRIIKLCLLSLLFTWFSACGDQASPLSGPVPNPGEVGVDRQSLGIKSGHFWVNQQAFNWLSNAKVGLWPEGLDLQEIDYGDMFADQPWKGRSESLGLDSKGNKIKQIDQIDPENEQGASIPGIGDYLSGSIWYKETIDISAGPVPANVKTIDIKISYVKDKTHPNLFFNLLADGDNIPVGSATHYPNEDWGRIRKPNFFYERRMRVFWSNIRGFDYFAELLYLAQKFWNPNLPSPRLADLVKVVEPGEFRFYASDLSDELYANNAYYAFDPTYLGSNPFIHSSKDWGPTWPIWVPETYDPSQVQAFKDQLTQQGDMPRSKRVAANYLGWALHTVQDTFVVMHANMELGDVHGGFEDAFSYFLKALEKPNFVANLRFPPLVGTYNISTGVPRFSDIFSDPEKFKASLPELCDNYFHYFHSAWKEYTTQQAYDMAIDIGRSFQGVVDDDDGYWRWIKTDINERDLYDRMIDDQVKFTIIAIACLQKENPTQPSTPQLTQTIGSIYITPRNTAAAQTNIDCSPNSLVNGIKINLNNRTFYPMIPVATYCIKNTSLTPLGGYWTDPIPNKFPDSRQCNDGEFVTAIHAEPNSSQLSLYCTKLQNAYHGNCYWTTTPIATTTDGGMYFYDGYYLAGAKCDGDGYLPLCRNISFYACQNPMMVKPTLTSPSTENISTNTPTYQWTPVANATHYLLAEFDASTNEYTYTKYAATEVGCYDGTNVCSVTRSSALPDTDIYWWIQPSSWWAGVGKWSDYRHFRVYTTPPVQPPTITSSANFTTNKPTFTWNAVDGATNYQLTLYQNMGGGVSNFIYRMTLGACNSSTCSQPDPMSLDDGFYTLEILASNPAGTTTTSSMAFTVSTKPPGKASLDFPTSGLVYTYQPTYTWEAVPNALWYTLWVNGSFSKKYTAAEAGCPRGTRKCSVTPDLQLSEGYNYYWHIITENTLGTSSSGEIYFTTTMEVPYKTTLYTPTHYIIKKNQTFEWEYVANAERFQLNIYDNNGNLQFSEMYAGDNLFATPINPALTFTDGSSWSWEIVAYNKLGATTSDTARFTATTKVLVSPSGVINTNNQTFQWKLLDNVARYYVFGYDQWGVQKFTYNKVMPDETSCPNNICSMTKTLSDGTVTWGVQAVLFSGESILSETKTFTVTSSTPGKATLLSPSDLITSNKPTFTWNAVPNATLYALSIYDGTEMLYGFKNYTAAQVGCASGTGVCSVVSPRTLVSGDGSWDIQTGNSIGYGDVTDPMTFTVNTSALPGKATLISPSGTVGNKPTFTWNAVSNAAQYYLSIYDSSESLCGFMAYSPAQAGCASGSGVCSGVYTRALADGAWTWDIEAVNEVGEGPYSYPMAFTTTSVAPTKSIHYWENPLPQGNNLNAAWSSGTNDAWAVGDYGTIMRWNGATWSRAVSGTTKNLNGIWGSNANNIWAVGAGGTILRWNSGAWSKVTINTTNDLNAVWGTSANDVWVVGASGTILRWNGTTWSTVASNTTNILYGVWGTGANDVWVVGASDIILRWNGTAWTTSKTSCTSCYPSLYNIWGSGANDVWITTNGSGALHWNGSTWSTVSSSVSYIRSIFGTGTNNIWAVGDKGAIIHWNGTSFVSVSTGTTTNLRGISGTGDNDLWIVGAAGTIKHWDGVSWSNVSNGAPYNLNSVWGNSLSNVWAVGNNNVILHRNDGAWSVMLLSQAKYAFNSIWGSSTNDVWAGGTNGTIMHWNGSDWLTVINDTAGTLNGIWGSGSKDVWVVGSSGTILHWNGSVWSSVASNTTNDLYSVWGTSATYAWAVGAGGTILRWNGTTWSSVASGTTNNLTSVWGSGSTDIWAVGASGTILHWNGTTWSSVVSGTTNNLTSVWGSGPYDIWAMGAGGLVQHWNGSSWSSVESGTLNAFKGVWGIGTGSVWTVGENGAILKWQ